MRGGRSVGRINRMWLSRGDEGQPDWISHGCAVVGFVAVIGGIYLISLPAALIVGGLALLVSSGAAGRKHQ